MTSVQTTLEADTELARAVFEPCLDPGCDGPPGWGVRKDDDGKERPRRTLWELLRHLRRDHQWPRKRRPSRAADAAAVP